MPSLGRQGSGVRIDAAWLSYAAPLLLFAALFLYGAMQAQTALALNIAMALLLMASLTNASVRKDFLRLRGLAVPGVCFAATIAVCFWSLTPYVPGGAHPIWAYAGQGAGAATIDKSTTLLETIKLAGLSVIFLVGAAAGAQDDRARLALRTLLIIGSLYALWAFFSHVTGAGPNGRTPRLEASLANPNASATLFGMLAVLLAGAAVRASKLERKTRPLALALVGGAALVVFACLLLTASRAGFAATLLGLAGFGLLQIFVGRAKPSRSMLIFLAGATVVVVLVFSLGDYLLTRSSNTEADWNVRLAIFAPHWDAFLASPLLGYGLGVFDTINKTLITEANFRVLWDVRAVHNVYLEWLEQAGLLGAIPMFLTIASLMFITLKRAASRKRMTALLFAAIASSLVVLGHGVTDFALEMYGLAAFWAFLLGLQFSLAQGRSTR